MAKAEELNGVAGMALRAQFDQRRFELLKETVFDPQTDEGRSRHTVYWDQHTRFVRIDRQNSFAGLEGEYRAHVTGLDEENAAKAAAGEPFVCLQVTLLAADESGDGLILDRRNLLLPLTPDPTSDQHRGGTVRLEGRAVAMRLRGPRAQVDIRKATEETVLREGFWAARVFGARDAADRFVAQRIELSPRPDPRTTDDPALPRVLVIGDSISMNYHDAAKAALHGIANYHRIEGNGGPSDRGVACTELWLGDYTQPGLHWDVIQFNHGLHDLKQSYDEQTQTFGRHQIGVEDYKANLARQIALLRRTGATLMWCDTTPVPTTSTGRWPQGMMGRRVGEEKVFNQAARQVLAEHPDILINELGAAVHHDEPFVAWWQSKDVHFWPSEQQQVLGRAVAEAIRRALAVHAARKAATQPPLP